MATDDFEEQPAQAIAVSCTSLTHVPHKADNQQDEYPDSLPEYHIPETKSSVSNKKMPNAVGRLLSEYTQCILTTSQPDPRFTKGDLVHRPVIVKGKRTKIAYTVFTSRYNPDGYTEYQVSDIYTNKLEGVWIREKELRAGG